MQRKSRLILLLLGSLLFTHQPEKKKAKLTARDDQFMKLELWRERHTPVYRSVNL